MSSEKPSRNIAAWIIVALICAALALGLSMPQIMPTKGGGGAQTLVSVHGHTINSGDWNYQFRLLANTLGGFNPKDEAQQKQVKAREAAIETLVERELAYQAARDAGLASVVEDAEELVKEGKIMSVGSTYIWRSPEEPFNYDSFRRGFVPQFMVNERDYLEHQRRATLAGTFYDLVSATAVISEPELRAYYDSDAERMGLRTVSFDPSAYEAIVEPSDQDIEAYTAKHKEQLNKTYEEQKARYQGLSPQMDLSLIAVAKGDDAKAAKTSIQGFLRTLKKKKHSFAHVARRYSTHFGTALKGGHYGYVDLKTAKESPGSVDLDSAVLAALVKMKPGQRSEVIEGEKEFFILSTGDKREGDLSQDEVVKELARKGLVAELSKKRAEKEAKALLTKLESGKSLASLLESDDGIKVTFGPAAEIKANTMTLPALPRGETPPMFGNHKDVIEKAWTLGKEGSFLPEVYELGNRFVVAEVQSLEKATDEGFAEKKEELRQQMLSQRAGALVYELLQKRCNAALGKGEVAPNGVQLRQLFSYGSGGAQAEAGYKICDNVGSLGRNLRYATMMQRFRSQLGSMPGQG